MPNAPNSHNPPEANNPPEVYHCEIIQKDRLSDNIYSILIDAELLSKLSRAGQFLNVHCGKERVLRRPISIASAGPGTIRIVFEKRGAGTDWLARRSAGDILNVFGPLGTPFTFSDGKIIAVGGGIGVAPVLYAASGASFGCDAILGFRGLNNVILEADFNAVCDDVYITSEDGSHGLKGLVTAPLEQLLQRGGYAAVLACGPRPMLKAVSELCLTYNVPCEVSLEERMACGIGACLVCNCRTIKDGAEFSARVCKDGPVFDSREVLW